MKVQGHNLIIALLAVLSCLPCGTGATAVGQDANAVNIRATLPPGRGLVAADVTVSKNRVRVGEWVTVTLVSPAGVTRPIFSVSFGDGKKQQTTKTQIDHKYGKAGHYDVYAWVVPRRVAPIVSLSANPKQVVVKRPVKFNAQINPDYPGVKYRFVFGDRDQTGWQDQPQTTHAYESASKYLAYVDVGAFDNGVIKPLSGSVRQPIEVNSLDPPPPLSVDLIAEPTRVEVGRRVTFNARAVSKDPNTSYRFVFGDGSQTGWQDRSQATHEYASAKTYFAHVEINAGRPGTRSASIASARKSIQVVKQQSVSVNLFVTPPKPDTDTLVIFTAQVNSKDPDIQFRFFYGDGSSSGWQAGSKATHKYSVANSYSAYVEAGLSNNKKGIKVLDRSKPEDVTVTDSATPTPTPTPKPTPTPTPTPTPMPVSSPTSSPGGSPTSSPVSSPTSSPDSSPGSSPGGSPSLSGPVTPTLSPGSSPTPPPDGPTDPFPWWYVLVVLLIGGGGYWAFKALFVPRPTFRSRADAGSSGVDETAKPLAIESQILLKPNIADGEYRVGTEEGNLIQSVRREND